MIGRDETFIERLPVGASYHSDLDGTKFLEGSHNGVLAVEGNLNRLAAPRATSGPFLPWRKLHIACPLQTQKKFAASHDFGHAIALLPIPETAQLLCDEFSALGSMLLNNGTDEKDITFSDPSASHDKWRIHGPLYKITLLNTPVLF